MSKRKLPSDVAFPISVTQLQDKLACVPQLSEIDFSYSYHKRMTDRRYQKTKFHNIKRISDREIMSASYERSAVSLTTPHWRLREDCGMNKYTKDRWKVILMAIPLAELAEVT